MPKSLQIDVQDVAKTVVQDVAKTYVQDVAHTAVVEADQDSSSSDEHDSTTSLSYLEKIVSNKDPSKELLKWYLDEKDEEEDKTYETDDEEEELWTPKSKGKALSTPKIPQTTKKIIVKGTIMRRSRLGRGKESWVFDHSIVVDKPTVIEEDGSEFVVFDKELTGKGSNKWKLTLYGKFVGCYMSENALRYHLRRMWSKCGFVDVQVDANDGCYFKFKNEEDMEK
ncbi:hypothetical protein Tco_1038535, partial [Tanacetum coccineum]